MAETLRSLRAPQPQEAEALVAFVAALNQPGPQHCLHLADSVAGVQADFDRDGIEPCRDFRIAGDDQVWLGAIGLDRDGDRAWLLGPWTRDAQDRALRRALLRAVMAVPDLALVRAFPDIRCAAILEDLEAAGFVRHAEVHVMQVSRGRQRPQADACVGIHIGDAEEGDAGDLAALHDSAFPKTWLPGADLLSHAREGGRLLVARDAQGHCLGSLCLALYPAVAEATIEFLAIRPGLRGRGIGSALLDRAMAESFEGGRAERVNLCVNDTNLDALRLYQRRGFERLYSGAGLRWVRDGEGPAEP